MNHAQVWCVALAPFANNMVKSRGEGLGSPLLYITINC